MGHIFLVGRHGYSLVNRRDFPLHVSSLDPAPHRGRALGSWVAPPLQVETTPSRTEGADVTSTVSASSSGSALAVPLTSASTSTSTCSPASVLANVSAPYTSFGQSSTGDAILIDDNVPTDATSGNDVAVFQPVESPLVQQRKTIVKVLLVCVHGL